MVQSLRKNSVGLSAGPCRIRLRALSIAPLPSATPVGYGCGSFRLCPVTRRLSGCGPCHPQPCRIRLRALPIAPRHFPPLPAAGPFGCPLCPFWLWRGGGAVKQPSASREDRLRRAAAVGSVWRKGGMTGGRRLPGLQGEAGRMVDGNCRGCKVGLVAWRAAVAGSARWAGPHGRRRLPGLQGEAGRMAGGGCRVCKVGWSHGGRRLPGL